VRWAQGGPSGEPNSPLIPGGCISASLPGFQSMFYWSLPSMGLQVPAGVPSSWGSANEGEPLHPGCQPCELCIFYPIPPAQNGAQTVQVRTAAAVPFSAPFHRSGCYPTSSFLTCCVHLSHVGDDTAAVPVRRSVCYDAFSPYFRRLFGIYNNLKGNKLLCYLALVLVT
jgi:hypothetical protein